MFTDSWKAVDNIEFPGKVARYREQMLPISTAHVFLPLVKILSFYLLFPLLFLYHPYYIDVFFQASEPIQLNFFHLPVSVFLPCLLPKYHGRNYHRGISSAPGHSSIGSLRKRGNFFLLNHSKKFLIKLLEDNVSFETQSEFCC